MENYFEEYVLTPEEEYEILMENLYRQKAGGIYYQPRLIADAEDLDAHIEKCNERNRRFYKRVTRFYDYNQNGNVFRDVERFEPNETK